MRQEIINALVRNGYDFTDNLAEDHYYFASDKIVISYVTPHEGTNWLHMIRAEIKEKFERWGNAQYEVFIENKDQIDKVLNELLKIK